MSSNAFLLSITAVSLAVALGGCGGKPDANAEASKVEDPFAMKEASTPTQMPSENPASAANAQAVGNADVKAFQSAGGTNGTAPAAIAARRAQQPSGITNDQGIALGESSPGTTDNFSKRTEMRARLRNGSKAVNDAQ